MAKTSSEKILARFKGLQTQMRDGEQPLYTTPIIWVNATTQESNACDLVLTNQRVFGYISITFPRARLFLDDLALESIRAVSLREKSYQGVFRELLVSDGQKKVYLRAPRAKIEATYAALREAIEQYASSAQSTPATDGLENESDDATAARQATPIFGRQEIRQSLERSPLGIALLLTGGLLLEIFGALAWASTRSAQIGLPLCAAGLIAVFVAMLTRRQLR